MYRSNRADKGRVVCKIFDATSLGMGILSREFLRVQKSKTTRFSMSFESSSLTIRIGQEKPFELGIKSLSLCYEMGNEDRRAFLWKA